MTDADDDPDLRRELESTGEAAVRADMNMRGGFVTGGEKRVQAVRGWLRDKEREREDREQRTDRYVRLTFWIALATLVAAVAGVIATMFHP